MADGKITYEVEVQARLDALRELQRSLQAEITSLRTLGGDTARLARAERELLRVRTELAGIPLWRKASAELSSFAARIPVLGSVMSTLNGSLARGGFIVAGIAAAYKTAESALRQWAGLEPKLIALEHSLAQQGKLSAQVRDEYAAIAQELQRLYGIADEESLGAITRLLKFGAPTNQIPSYLRTIVDLADKVGTDVPTASLMFVRAMHGNTTALARYGIEIDKTLPREAQLAQLASQVAGARAKLDPSTMTGAWRQLWTNIKDGLASFGSWLAPASAALANFLNFFASAFARLPRRLRPINDEANRISTLKPAADAAADGIDAIGASAEQAAEGPLKKLADQLAEVRSEAEKLADAQLAERLADIELAAATGELTPAQAEAARAAAIGSARQAGLAGELEDARKRQAAAEEAYRLARTAAGDALAQMESLTKHTQAQLAPVAERARRLGVRTPPGFEAADAGQAFQRTAALQRNVEAEIDRRRHNLEAGAGTQAELDALIAFKAELTRIAPALDAAGQQYAVESKRWVKGLDDGAAAAKAAAAEAAKVEELETQARAAAKGTKADVTVAQQKQKEEAAQKKKESEDRNRRAKSLIDDLQISEAEARGDSETAEKLRRSKRVEEETRKFTDLGYGAEAARAAAERKVAAETQAEKRSFAKPLAAHAIQADALARIGGFVGPRVHGATTDHLKRAADLLAKIEAKLPDRKTLPPDDR